MPEKAVGTGPRVEATPRCKENEQRQLLAPFAYGVVDPWPVHSIPSKSLRPRRDACRAAARRHRARCCCDWRQGGYDADGVRACIRDHGAIPNIPNRSNCKTRFRWKKSLYRQRNHVERFFNKLSSFGGLPRDTISSVPTSSLSSSPPPCEFGCGQFSPWPRTCGRKSIAS
jgi:transposase